jgi:hypothetical protein
MEGPRFVVKSVEMYDVVDMLTAQIVLNTRDQQAANDAAVDHEELNRPKEEGEQ